MKEQQAMKHTSKVPSTSMSLSLSHPSKLENTWCIIWNGFKGHTTDEQPPYNYVPYNHHREMKRHKSAIIKRMKE